MLLPNIIYWLTNRTLETIFTFHGYSIDSFKNKTNATREQTSRIQHKSAPRSKYEIKIFKYAKRHYRENFNNYTFLENTQNDTDSRSVRLIDISLKTNEYINSLVLSAL